MLSFIAHLYHTSGTSALQGSLHYVALRWCHHGSVVWSVESAQSHQGQPDRSFLTLIHSAAEQPGHTCRHGTLRWVSAVQVNQRRGSSRSALRTWTLIYVQLTWQSEYQRQNMWSAACWHIWVTLWRRNNSWSVSEVWIKCVWHTSVKITERHAAAPIFTILIILRWLK